MKKYTTPIMKKYLTDLLKRIDPTSTPNLEGLSREECLDLWYGLKDRYEIMKRGNRYVILQPDPEKKKHYEVLLEKFNIDSTWLNLKSFISKKANKENFFKVYNKAIEHLPDRDQKHLKKIKYYSERSTPRLYLDGITIYNLSQESKEFIMKLWEIFIA